MAELKPGDDVKIGQKIKEKTDEGVSYGEVALPAMKNYTRGGVVAKIAVLELELAKFQEILADIDAEE